MAQGDLYRLLNRVSGALAKDMDAKGKGSERFRERIDKYPHDVHINRNSIRDEILIQLNEFKMADAQGVTQAARRAFGSATGNTREQAAAGVQSLATPEGFSKAQLTVIEQQADAFVKDALTLAKSKAPRGIKITKISGDDKNFVLRFTPTAKNASVYDAINKTIFQPAKARLAKQLSEKGFPIDTAKERRLFNVGHIHAVSTLKAVRALSSINKGTDRILQKYTDPVANEAADVLRLNIMSRFTQLGNPEFAKEFLIKSASVRPESEATNLTDSDYEAALLRDVRASIEKTLKSLPVDWATQKSSDSVMDVLTKYVADQALKVKSSSTIKVKVNDPGKPDTTSNTSPDVIVKIPKQKLSPIDDTLSTFGGLELPQANVQRVQSSAISLSSLIPLLNQSLPEFIRANMGQAGRLINRTGRFSESGQIVSIDDDTSTISYTYQLDPYAKFERDTRRDPRPLIEQSIRDTARGIIDAKFTMRRV